jgi:hypothetical protein
VVHWETLANISEFLQDYTADFAKGCMSYRHLRFFRSTSDQKVWLQVASRMNNYGDPTDEWRGLAPMSTHTLCFNTGYGIPDLCRAFENDDFPDSKVRPLDQEEHDNVVAGLKKIHDYFHHFTEDNLKDCLAVLDLYKADPTPFPWTEADMKLLYNRDARREADAVQAQEASGLPVGKVGEFYLCKSGEPDGDAFMIGVIRKICTHPRDGPGVGMQWFELADSGACKYTSKYKTHLRTSTRVDKFPFCSDECLQYKLKVRKVTREKTGVVKAFYVAQRDVKNVKYYEERFKGGSDLQPRQHERVLPLHAIH